MSKTMSQTRTETQNPVSFARLMRLGQVAHAQGDSKAAHDYWRQAAMIEPDNEQVWTALMWVLDGDEDRKVCLRNILAINPQNFRAQAMLDELLGDTKADERVKADTQALDATAGLSLGYVVLRFAEALWLGGLIATVIILVQFLF